MSGKGAHVNVLGERIRRYYEHLMTDAQTFVGELRKDLEGPSRNRDDRTATRPGARDTRPAAEPPGTAPHPGRRGN